MSSDMKPLMAAAFGAFGAGIIASVWLHDWRWLVTGFVLMIVLAAASSAGSRR